MGELTQLDSLAMMRIACFVAIVALTAAYNGEQGDFVTMLDESELADLTGPTGIPNVDKQVAAHAKKMEEKEEKKEKEILDAAKAKKKKNPPPPKKKKKKKKKKS